MTKTANTTPRLKDVFDSGCSEWIEERYTHPDVQCDACLKSIVGVRYRCSSCDDFDLCSSCYPSRGKSHEQDHEFYWIQYRRYSLPPPKGEDLEQLRRFRAGQSSDSFYFHYPWLFSLEVFDQLIDGTKAQGHQRSVISQIRENCRDDEFQLVLDMYIRQTGLEDWNWHRVQERVQPLVDLQLIRAEYSPYFYDLYKALSDEGNSSTGLSEMTADQVMALKKQLYDSHLSQDELTLLKKTFQNYASVHEELLRCGGVGTYDDRVSNRAKYLETLSTHFDSNAFSLPILEEVEQLLAQRKQHEDRPGRWIVAEYETRRDEVHRLYETFSGELERYVTAPPSQVVGSPAADIRSQSPHSDLAEFLQHSRSWDFESAQNIIFKLDTRDPTTAFEVMRMHELRGSILNALCVAEPFTEGKIYLESGISTLFSIATAYFNCFHRGLWTDALKTATSCYTEGLFHASFISAPKTKSIIEIYCYKIFLAASHDLGQDLQPKFVGELSAHLRHLRQTLQSMREHDLALDVLELEVKIHQEEITVFELEQVEYLQHRKSSIPNMENARIVCTEFINTIQEEELPGKEAGISEGFAWLLLVMAIAEKPDRVSHQIELEEYTQHAETIFSDLNCSLGLGNVNLLRLGANIGREGMTTDWTPIEAVFDRHGYLTGALKLEIDRAARDTDVRNAKVVSTRPKLYEKLLPIVKSTGNELLYQLYSLRSMTSWIQGPAFIATCERVFHPVEGFLSDELCVEASRLLSQLYRLNNNFPEASAYALLYLKYAHKRSDPRMLNHASMNYLQLVGDLTATVPEDDRIFELLNLSVSFDRMVYRLCRSTLTGLQDPTVTIPYSDLPIESLLWLAKSVRCATEENFTPSMSSQLIRTLYRTLQFSVDLLSLLPSTFQRLFQCKVCAALGTAAELCANPVLSLLCYDLGQELALGVDGFDLSSLRLQIGRRLSSWIYHDRSNFLIFQELAWTYLRSAEEFFWGEGAHQLSFKNGLETSMVLSRSNLREVQFLIENVDWGEAETEAEPEETPTLAQVGNKDKLMDLVENGLASIDKAFAGNLVLRRKLVGMPPMQALENNRLFYFGDMEELCWINMGLEMDRSRVTGDPYPMWQAIQKWKAISLVDLISQSLEQTIQPKDLIGSADERIDIEPKTKHLTQLMKDATVTHTFDEDSIWSMAEIAEQHLGNGESIIFIDWARYYDTLFILAFNGTSGALRKGVIEYDYHKIQEWVLRNLGVSSLQDGRTARKRLTKSSKLNELKPILEPLNGFVKENDMLVLCPSGILHAVPLQAIPFGPKGKPLIASNPVVFCASLSLLENCISKTSSSDSSKPFTAAAFTRLGPEDPIEEERMRATAEKAMKYTGNETCVTGGRKVTRQAFLQRSKAVNLLHYHGHAYLEASQRKDRALVLEPVSPDDGLFTVMDLFELQLDSAVVMLLACASGEEDVAPNDDPLGLLSAFMYAGASSVIATLWPTQTSDARDFCERVYKHAFGGKGSGSKFLAKSVQKTVVEMWEEWDEDEPYHWAQFQLHGAWYCRSPICPES